MNLNLKHNFLTSLAYVVFEDNTSLWWLKLLKKNFRHCYMLLPLSDECWLEFNPMSNQVFVKIRSLQDIFNLKECTICEVEIKNAPHKCAPLGFFTCVEFTKRILGLHDLFIITPHQLYNKIKDCRKKVLTL